MRWGCLACAAAMLCGCGDANLEMGRALEARRAAAATPRYTIVRIPPLAGHVFAAAWDIDERDQVAGASYDNETPSGVPFLWDPVHGSRRLLDIHGRAAAVNENGDVAATWAGACDGQTTHAVRARTDGGTFRDLGSLDDPGSSCAAPRWSEGLAMNRSGVIVGCSQRLDRAVRAFHTSGDQLVEIPTPGGPSSESCAYSINDRGQVAGEMPGDLSSFHHAFIFEGGQLTDIGSGYPGGSSANAINEYGQVAGDLSPPDFSPHHAFFYDQGVLHDLGAIGPAMRVVGMNDRAQIIGGTGSRAFLWEHGAFYDLQSLVDDPSAHLYEARAINNQGHIVANAQMDGRDTLLLLVPVSGPLVAVATLDSSEAQGYAPLWEGFDGTRSYTTDPSTWITACRWSFGDGTPDAQSCWALHVYAQPGAYAATLTVTDNLGREASSSIAITALQNPGPVPVVDYGPPSGPAPHDVFMDGTRSYAVRQNSWITTCRWDFGDGSAPETRCWALHTYVQPGHYTIRFTVTDDQGVSNTQALDIDAR